MKKIIRFISILGLLILQTQLSAEVDTQNKKKEIFIFVIRGGGGHISAANSISDILKDDYETKILNPFTDPEIFEEFDFVRKISFNALNCEDLYNLLLRNRWNWCINRLSDFGSHWIDNHKKRLKKKLVNYLKIKKPHMIISVIPYLNGVILEATQELKIPFLAIPTDLNTETFAMGMKPGKYKNFNFSLAFDDELLLDKIKSFNLDKENIKYIGYPLRKEFFEKKDKEKIKEEFNIPDNKHVIMILMGAEGSSAIYSYVYHLIKSKLPMHLIICSGRNEALRLKLEKIKFPDYISKTIFGFTNRVADLMTVSDLFITKPGSHSVCEAIQMGIPILTDQTIIGLNWERLNGDFIKKYSIGEVIKNYRKLNKVVSKFLTDEKFKVILKKNTEKLKRESFSKPLKEVINQMLGEKVKNEI